MTPLASILIPAYNAERFLPQTLLSVERQTLRPIECVVVNDGSTDATAKILADWQRCSGSENLQIKVVQQSNAGLIASRATGLKTSVAEFIQFLDADDILHPSKLHVCVNELRKSQQDAIVPRTRIFSADAEAKAFMDADVEAWAWPEDIHSSSTITSQYWHSVGPVFRRDVIERLAKFPTDINPYAEELELHGRVKLGTQKICFYDACLSLYRKGNPASLTGALQAVARGRVDGARIAESLLKEFHCEAVKEWRSLAKMAFRTYVQTCSLKYEADLRQEAWADAIRLISRTKPAWGAMIQRCPQHLTYLLLRTINKFRARAD